MKNYQENSIFFIFKFVYMHETSILSNFICCFLCPISCLLCKNSFKWNIATQFLTFILHLIPSSRFFLQYEVNFTVKILSKEFLLRKKINWSHLYTTIPCWEYHLQFHKECCHHLQKKFPECLLLVLKAEIRRGS